MKKDLGWSNAWGEVVPKEVRECTHKLMGKRIGPGEVYLYECPHCNYIYKTDEGD